MENGPGMRYMRGLSDMVVREAGEFRNFDGKKYMRVASRSNKERALVVKDRLVAGGAIRVRILKVQPNVVGLSHHYAVYARRADDANENWPWVRSYISRKLH